MMNIQPGSSTRRQSPKRTVENVNGVSEFFSVLARVGQTALVIMACGAFFYAYITLDNKISRTVTDMEGVNDEIARVEREIVRLKVEEARLSTRSHIMAQVRRYNLPLVPARYTQIRSLRVLTVEQAARTPLLRPVYNSTAQNKTQRGN
jgi:hypothetical protein